MRLPSEEYQGRIIGFLCFAFIVALAAAFVAVCIAIVIGFFVAAFSCPT